VVYILFFSLLDTLKPFLIKIINQIIILLLSKPLDRNRWSSGVASKVSRLNSTGFLFMGADVWINASDCTRNGRDSDRQD
jgi:hypothetical protein